MTRSKIAMRQEHSRKKLLDFRSMTRNFLNGSAERVRRNADRKEVKAMTREQMKAMLDYLEIERQTQEKLAQVRQELAKLVYVSRVDLDANLY